MQTAAGEAPDRGAAAAPEVMLLCVCRRPGADWSARIVLPNAAVHEFRSPFELAQFIGQAPPAAHPATQGRGLR